jgi:hypothetical protein
MRTTDRWVRRAGFVLGLAAAAALVGAARLPAQPRDLGLDLTVAAAPPAHLTVKPGGPLVTASGLRAGGRQSGARGRATLINPSAVAERVRIRALPSSHALDRALMVDLTVAGRAVYHGPLGALRAGARPFRLGSGDALAVGVRVWLPAGATGWHGRIEDLALTFDAVPAPAR